MKKETYFAFQCLVLLTSILKLQDLKQSLILNYLILKDTMLMNINYKFLIMMEESLPYMLKFPKIWLVKELIFIVKEFLLTL